jgi:hypothetical protein
MTTLLCPECQHENETERIYCHDCGTRLDRTKLTPKTVENGESDKQAQRRLQRMFDPARGRIKRFSFKTVKFVLGALCCAAVVVMLLPPNLPPEPKNYEFAPMIHMDMLSALASRQTTPLVYTEQQVNSYIASIVRRKDGPASKGFFPVRRLFVQFQEGLCTVHVEGQIYGSLSFYSASTYRVRLENGKLSAEPISTFVGRMPIHPALLKAGNPLFLPAWTALARDRDSVARLAGIEFHPQSVSLLAGLQN